MVNWVMFLIKLVFYFYIYLNVFLNEILKNVEYINGFLVFLGWYWKNVILCCEMCMKCMEIGFY